MSELDESLLSDGDETMGRPEASAIEDATIEPADADLVIVVGSRNSSNSVRLVEVALEAGAKAAHRVDNAGEVDPAWLEGVEKVGVTSGASVPDELVQGVLAFLEEQGYPAAVEERLTEENLVFALPPELRKDLKRASA